jgi:hypothetical protein
MDVIQEEYQAVVDRVREISKARVELFDKGDGSYGSEHSRQLWREYQNLHKKYGGNEDPLGKNLWQVYNDVWDNEE